MPQLPNVVRASVILKWNIHKIKHRNCPVCDYDFPLPIVKRPDGLIVFKCQNCKMIYLADVPGKEDIDKFYELYGKFKGYKFHGYRNWLANQLSIERNPYISILEESGVIGGMSICDIGCSYGAFLQLIRQKGNP